MGKQLAFGQRHNQRLCMFLSISIFLLAPNLVFTHSLPQSHLLALSILAQRFKLVDIFQGSHIVVFSILGCHQVRIRTSIFDDDEASGYVFMDQNLTQKHSFLLYKLKHPQRLFGFDGQSA